MTDIRTQVAAATFMPVLDGYVFREPYRWPFTQSPHYLVNEAQRDRLLAMTVPKRPILWQSRYGGTLCRWWPGLDSWSGLLLGMRTRP
jgi:hypothetical protein